MDKEKIKFLEKVLKEERPVVMPKELSDAITYEHFKNVSRDLELLQRWQNYSLMIAHSGKSTLKSPYLH